MTRELPHAAVEVKDSRRFFVLGCSFELVLGGLGLLALLSMERPFRDWWRVDFTTIGLSLVATLPLVGLFYLTMHARARPLLSIRTWLETMLRPLLRPWAVWQMGLLSLLAGWSEEVFFRGALQGWITQAWSPLPAIVLASLAFGAMHAVTPSYAVFATLLGLYLGVLCWFTQSLAAPVLTHALYDFLALLYLLRAFTPETPAPRTGS